MGVWYLCIQTLLFLFFFFFPFLLLSCFYSSVYSWEISRSLITEGCMILTQAHDLWMVNEMHHRSSFRHHLSQCILTSTVPHHMASVKLAPCSSSVKDQHEWVWAVQQSQITTGATSEMKQGTEGLRYSFTKLFLLSFLLQRESAMGEIKEPALD